MKILIVNDDGIFAEGIYCLAKQVAKRHEVVVVAPEEQRSAQSHAITIYKPIVIREVRLPEATFEAYSITGTPADCVRVGIEGILKAKPDFVLSGINHGCNLGADILYSGTVSAAIEASLYEIPAIAYSTDVDAEMQGNFEIAAEFAAEFLEQVRERMAETGMVLNVNIPKRAREEMLGFRVCELGEVIYDYYREEISPEGRREIRPVHRRQGETAKDSDRDVVSRGHISVTPLHYDLTNYRWMDEVRGWLSP